MNKGSDYSSGWSSSDEECGDSNIQENQDVKTKSVKQTELKKNVKTINSQNSCAPLIPQKRAYLNRQNDDCQGLSVRKESSNNDCEPSPKQLKTDNARSTSNAAKTVDINEDAHLEICDEFEQTNGHGLAQQNDEASEEGDSSDLSSSDEEPEDSQTQNQQTGATNDRRMHPANSSVSNSVAPPAPEEPLEYHPVFLLGPMGDKAHVDINAKERMPLFFTDVKDLLAFAGVGIAHAPIPGPWWRLSREHLVPQTVFLLVEGLALDDFVEHRDCFPNLDAIFPAKLEVITPAAYDGNFIEELVLIPMSRGKQRGLLLNYSCIEGALLRHNNLFGYRQLQESDMPENTPVRGSKEDQERIIKKKKDDHNYKSFIEVMKKRRARTVQEEENKRRASIKSRPGKFMQKPSEVLPSKVYEKKLLLENLPPNDRFPRTQLLLSQKQQVSEGVPIPLGGCFVDRYGDYVPTKDLYAPATAHSPMFAIDCEMVMTTAGSGILELARVSIVDESLKCIYDEHVKPDNEVTNHLTRYSGVTAASLANVTKRLGDVHRDIRALLPMDAILLGHSICSDLHALRMVHPYLIDTSVIFNLNEQVRCKAKLATLSQLLLGETIQSDRGHCSTEDSQACMKLVQLKLSKDIAFGDTMLERNRESWPQPGSGERALPPDSWKEFPISAQRVGFAATFELEKCKLVVAEKLARERQRLDLKRLMPARKKSDWMFDMTLADHLFSLLKFVGKSAVLIGTEKEIRRHNEWKPQVKSTLRTFVDVIAATDTRDVFVKVSKSLRYQFVVGHAHFAPEIVEKAKVADKKKIFSAIDESCKKIWDSVTEDGLCVIVFGGRSRGTNGLCFVRVNNDLKEIIKSTPQGPKLADDL